MKVGIITYHSAYNFGSVLQAFATERIIRKMSHEPYIINYRIPFQKKYYGILGYGRGIKAPIKKLLMIPQIKDRIERQKRYESFISLMTLTKEYNKPSDLAEISTAYDVYISGSDQTWNIHSNEYLNSGYEYLYPYLLNFTEKKKISYASSIVNMSDDELEILQDYLLEFYMISCREAVATERLSRLINRQVTRVLDPTLLMNNSDWRRILSTNSSSIENKRYILYYSIKNYGDSKNDLILLDDIAEKMECKIIALTPLIPLIKGRNIINVPDCGPKEFINYIDNATMVVTDSYHGMLFSINFEKNFYYLRNEKGDKGIRANDILSSLNLQYRILDNVNMIEIGKNIMYDKVSPRLNELRKESIDYLQKALE